MHHRILLLWAAALAIVLSAAAARAQQAAAADQAAERGADRPPAKEPADPAAEPAAKEPPGLVRLAKDYDVWMDPVRKYVVVDGRVCLREGLLEMFACPKGTKEHESIVAIDCPAHFVHAGLLAVGAKPGTPVQFDPQYAPPTGTEIDIWVLWIDKHGKRHKTRAQQWVRNVRTRKAMQHHWVFAGSGFWTDPETKQRHYLGDGGDFICVSNFTTATLDVTTRSSAKAEQLMFEAFTEHIPSLDTEVRLVLVPKLPKDQPGKERPQAAPPESPAGK